jgi:hypothetical protein
MQGPTCVFWANLADTFLAPPLPAAEHTREGEEAAEAVARARGRAAGAPVRGAAASARAAAAAEPAQAEWARGRLVADFERDGLCSRGR